MKELFLSLVRFFIPCFGRGHDWEFITRTDREKFYQCRLCGAEEVRLVIEHEVPDSHENSP